MVDVGHGEKRESKNVNDLNISEKGYEVLDLEC